MKWLLNQFFISRINYTELTDISTDMLPFSLLNPWGRGSKDVSWLPAMTNLSLCGSSPEIEHKRLKSHKCLVFETTIH